MKNSRSPQAGELLPQGSHKGLLRSGVSPSLTIPTTRSAYSKALQPVEGPRESFAVYVEWVLVQRGFLYTFCIANEDNISPTPNPSLPTHRLHLCSTLPRLHHGLSSLRLCRLPRRSGSASDLQISGSTLTLHPSGFSRAPPSLWFRHCTLWRRLCPDL